MKGELKKFLVICLLSSFSILMVSKLSDSPIYVSILLFAIGLAMLSVIGWSKPCVLCYLIIFVSGPLAESSCIHLGVWTYANPAFFGIPLWLPFLWGNAGLYILSLKLLIDSSFRKTALPH